MKNTIDLMIIRVLKPLIKILIKYGISYGKFSELAKKVYVHVGVTDFEIFGRKQTISRISTITGINRKEVKKLTEYPWSSVFNESANHNRASRVVNGWLQDRCFHDSTGQPLALTFKESEDEPGFFNLVKKYSGDIPARAILDELLRVGVVMYDKQKVTLLNRGYIVHHGIADKLEILGADVSDLISTINHNLECENSDHFIQRKVFYDNIPDDLLHEVRKEAFDKGEHFIEKMNQLLSGYDKDANKKLTGEGKKRAGIGLFYFE